MSQEPVTVLRMAEQHHTSHLKAIIAAAHLAGTDPERCVAVAEMVRAAGVALGLAVRLEDGEQDAFLVVGEVSVGEDRDFDARADVDAEGNPTEMA